MATGKLLGTDTQGAQNEGADYALYSRFQALYTGKIQSIKIYSKASGQAKVAIYADDNDAPGNRLTGNDSAQNVSANQWNELTIGETEINKDTYYWLAHIVSILGAISLTPSGGTRKYKAASFSTWTWPATAGGGLTDQIYLSSIAGWGILVLSPSSITQSITIGEPTVSLGSAGQTIAPSSIVQAIGIGAPVLLYPQTISPSSIIITVSIGTPWVGIFGFIKPQSTIQPVAIGTPIILKYVWHVILDGRYATETPEVNRAYVIGTDANDNPVFGEAIDSTEVVLVGERLDFQQAPAIPTDSQAASMASAILSKMRLMGKRGVILIPPNCGQELFDMVQISDSGANQSAVKFRVVAIRFEYNPRQARYEQRLILGAP